jgi:predicted DNA-binding transcriptional regulator AlpA
VSWHTETTSNGVIADLAAPASRPSNRVVDAQVPPSSTTQTSITDASIGSDWLPPGQVAQLLGRSTAALAQMRHRGTGPRYTKVASRILYRRSSIAQWLESAERDRT